MGKVIYEDKLMQDLRRMGEIPDDVRVKVLAAVSRQPAADVAPVVHGRWIPIEYDGYADGNPVWDLWECSECREEQGGDEDSLTPYCPWCGAKMDGGNADGICKEN